MIIRAAIELVQSTYHYTYQRKTYYALRSSNLIKISGLTAQNTTIAVLCASSRCLAVGPPSSSLDFRTLNRGVRDLVSPIIIRIIVSKHSTYHVEFFSCLPTQISDSFTLFQAVKTFGVLETVALRRLRRMA